MASQSVSEFREVGVAYPVALSHAFVVVILVPQLPLKALSAVLCSVRRWGVDKVQNVVNNGVCQSVKLRRETDNLTHSRLCSKECEFPRVECLSLSVLDTSGAASSRCDASRRPSTRKDTEVEQHHQVSKGWSFLAS